MQVEKYYDNDCKFKTCFLWSLLQSIDLHNWIVINTECDSRTADKFIDIMKRNSRPLGIQIKQPQLNKLNSDSTIAYVIKVLMFFIGSQEWCYTSITYIWQLSSTQLYKKEPWTKKISSMLHFGAYFSYTPHKRHRIAVRSLQVWRFTAALQYTTYCMYSVYTLSNSRLCRLHVLCGANRHLRSEDSSEELSYLWYRHRKELCVRNSPIFFVLINFDQFLLVSFM